MEELNNILTVINHITNDIDNNNDFSPSKVIKVPDGYLVEMISNVENEIKKNTKKRKKVKVPKLINKRLILKRIQETEKKYQDRLNEIKSFEDIWYHILSIIFFLFRYPKKKKIKKIKKIMHIVRKKIRFHDETIPKRTIKAMGYSLVGAIVLHNAFAQLEENYSTKTISEFFLIDESLLNDFIK
jgi:hypothetical protein